MITQEHIKSGLHFQLKIIPGFRENNSFLKQTNDSISLTYVYTGLDYNIHCRGINIAHEIQFTFHSDFLNNFSSSEQEFSIHQFPDQQIDICCNTQMILYEIINCRLSGAFRKMFLESKALALLLCFQRCYISDQTECSSCKFLTKPIEKEKILKAKKIILMRLNNPPTIQELSRQIGINQCYLKKGFKELFGTTVYDYIQEQRMKNAKLLLSTTDLSVSQIAYKIGFSSTGNFSSAFKKHVGVIPSELKGN